MNPKLLPGNLYVMMHKSPWRDRDGSTHVHVTRLVARITRVTRGSVLWENAKVLAEYDRPPVEIATDVEGGGISLNHIAGKFETPLSSDIDGITTMVGDHADYEVMRRMRQRCILTGKAKGSVRTLAQQVTYLEKVRQVEQAI